MPSQHDSRRVMVPAPAKTRRQLKRERTQPEHVCSMCENFYPEIRYYHGELLKRALKYKYTWNELRRAEYSMKIWNSNIKARKLRIRSHGQERGAWEQRSWENQLLRKTLDT